VWFYAFDDQGGRGQVKKVVTVDATGANVAPTPVIAVSCSKLSCSFDGSKSWDADGTIGTWTWDFGDGTSGAGAQASHAYSGPGSYTAKLTVTDDRGGSATATRAVTIKIVASGSILPLASYLSIASIGWENATSANVDLYRNGALYDTVENSGAFDDWLWFATSGTTYKYKVCQAGTTVCSNVVTLVVP
jgi:PKD repeat protein